MRKLFMAAFLPVLILTACASLGLTKPTTFNQQAATAYGAATSILQTADTLLKAGKITSADAANVEAQADNLKAGIDIARVTYATDQATAGNKLAATLTAIQALTQYLSTKGT